MQPQSAICPLWAPKLPSVKLATPPTLPLAAHTTPLATVWGFGSETAGIWTRWGLSPAAWSQSKAELAFEPAFEKVLAQPLLPDKNPDDSPVGGREEGSGGTGQLVGGSHSVPWARAPLSIMHGWLLGG